MFKFFSGITSKKNISSRSFHSRWDKSQENLNRLEKLLNLKAKANIYEILPSTSYLLKFHSKDEFEINYAKVSELISELDITVTSSPKFFVIEIEKNSELENGMHNATYSKDITYRLHRCLEKHLAKEASFLDNQNSTTPGFSM